MDFDHPNSGTSFVRQVGGVLSWCALMTMAVVGLAIG